MHTETLSEMLLRHEGYRQFMYYDTVGVPTCGVGRNLQDKGLSKEEAEFLLDNDIAECQEDLKKEYLWFQDLNRARSNAMTDMRFNLGSAGFAKFKRMIEAMEQKDYEQAAHEMMDSKWAIQVGQRANELSCMVSSGHRC